VKGVSGALFDAAATQFSLSAYEATWAVWADESVRHLQKQCQGLLLIGQ